MIFKVTEDFWDLTISCIFVPHHQLGDHIEAQYGGEMAEAVDHIDENYDGSSLVMPNGDLIIWLAASPTGPDGIGVLTHEIFHTIKHFLGSVQGMPLVDETEEVYARLLGSLVVKVLKTVTKIQ